MMTAKISGTTVVEPRLLAEPTDGTSGIPKAFHKNLKKEGGNMRAGSKYSLSLVCVTLLLTFFLYGQASAARLGLAGDEGPEVIDGARQRTIEIMGIAEGGNFNDVQLHAEWSSSQKKDSSPAIRVGGQENFSHTFPIGGPQNRGLVTFYATGKLKGVSFNSEKRYKYVDVDPPRVLIGKPVDGQFVAGGVLWMEMHFEDDLFAAPAYKGKYGLQGYRLAIDVNGENQEDVPVFTHSHPFLHKQKVLIPRQEGRHGIRVRFSDLTGKTDEKTIWVNVDTTPPNVHILSPAAGQTVTIPSGGFPVITVEVEASDAGNVKSGMNKVEFYLDGAGVAVAETPNDQGKYAGMFGVSSQGQKTIQVKAFDKVGNSADSSVRVNVVFAGSTAPIEKVPAPSRTLPARTR